MVIKVCYLGYHVITESSHLDNRTLEKILPGIMSFDFVNDFRMVA